tara:strand:- start:3898 stop:4692 length:795 start_codon:yes stop_codon:yes gene_type:complete
MTRIIGISGKKQSGKSTSANWFHGLVLKEQGLVTDFNVDSGGKLAIETFDKSQTKGWGVFDVERKDEPFIEYAEEVMWPHVKMYSFADTLKSLSVHLFGLHPEQVYGSGADKNSLTQFRWENMPKLFDSQALKVKAAPDAIRSFNWKNGPMTAREFMQFFGTEIMRKMYPNIWVDNTIKKILAEGSELAVIPDVRFPNEVEAILSNGGEVIRLTRVHEEDSHASETCLDPDSFDQSKFTHIIENADIGMDGLFNKLTKIYRGAK